MQAGFRRNYSTTDQIFYLYAIAQKCMNKKSQKFYAVFMDFRKAFESVHHDKLLQAMQKKGVKGKFFFSIKSMYDSLLSCVRANNEYSDFFSIVPLVSARGVYLVLPFSPFSLISLPIILLRQVDMVYNSCRDSLNCSYSFLQMM